MTVYVVSHPEVAVDPAVPVPRWGLSAAGRERLVHLLALPWAGSLTRVVSSTETKAVQTARALAAPLGLQVVTDEELGENDRSATGFVPPAEFEELADAFFAHPGTSVRGWETAEHAQARFAAAVRRRLDGHDDGDVAVVAHGGVGTLLLCQLLGVAVTRDLDQPGQGSWYAFEPLSGLVHHGWRRIGPPEEDRR
ncbi:histidine phosphatase family protein [Streptomyces sp. NP160]|uniref:histidine phosphatase family protein n=1 Tax=Streptomyces sp. NP160 TaxID=2586637 RepID=UPI0015D5A5E5|nr:histidine phosphatase family protein [Streptomyces sp. NP160]